MAVTIPEEDILKTTFVLHNLFVLPTLKLAMKTLIGDLDDIDYYWDDILVHTRTYP